MKVAVLVQNVLEEPETERRDLLGGTKGNRTVSFHISRQSNYLFLKKANIVKNVLLGTPASDFSMERGTNLPITQFFFQRSIFSGKLRIGSQAEIKYSKKHYI